MSLPSTNTSVDDASLPSRFVVGIDLGTTNSAVCYVDTQEPVWRVRTFAIPQLVDAGQVEARETLPSFHYQPASGESQAGSLQLPWSDREADYAVGVYARERGTRTPGRLIASAKSWLCHTGVDRTAELLPWHGAADVDRLSPVEASARYLRHMREAWDHRFPRDPLAEQDVVLTLPASFDEVARELTVQAAKIAGLPRVVLIEEPQAAFYAWIDTHAEDWEQRVEPGQKILVCDIGGGTSDFTLIRVRRGEGDTVQFHRVAVGDHLILGGDNLDLALAKHLEEQLGGTLQPHQWDALVRTCRRVKEDALLEGGNERLSFNLPGAGSKLIGGGLRVEVHRDDVRRLLLDGFFPFVGLDERPHREQSGFREFGLPYAADPAITRHLASFLVTHQHAGDDLTPGERGRAGGLASARPDVVLFNGGVFASTAIQQRVLDALRRWFADSESGWSPAVLENERLDLAVARGAAYYGTVRRGRGVKIAAGLARSYYIGVEGDPPAAVCLVPGNVEPGQEIDLTQHSFELLVHQPAEFPLHVSSTRLTDVPGEVMEVDPEQMKSLPPIRTVLRTRGKKQAGAIRVNLHARLTEIGTLELWCSDARTDRRWRLQFDVRSATQTDVDAAETAGEAEGTIEESAWEQCQEVIHRVFVTGTEKPAGLVKRLVASLDMDRNDWPMSLLRRIWETLMDVEPGRRSSAAHEARWLNLLGFALRPGYGMAMDDWRVAETWRILQGKLAHGTANCRTESWILWRRLAGGLSAGQQRAVADTLLPSVRGLHRRMVKGKGGGDFGFTPQQSVEMWRLLGSLELLVTREKIRLGDMIVDLMGRKSLRPSRDAMVWALGRIGSRAPLYGPLNTVVPTEVTKRWLQALMKGRDLSEADKLAAMQLGRRIGDRYRDLDDKTRREVLDWLRACDAPEHYVDLVQDGGALHSEEQGHVFGETLPKGLRIS